MEAATKEQYVEEVEEKMSDWDRRIEAIVRKADESQKESALVQDLLDKQKEAKSQFEELRSADEAKFEELKGRVGVATQDLQDVLVRTSERFEMPSPRQPSGPLPPGQRERSAAEDDGSAAEPSVESEAGSPKE